MVTVQKVRRIFFAWRMLQIIWMYMCYKISAHSHVDSVDDINKSGRHTSKHKKIPSTQRRTKSSKAWLYKAKHVVFFLHTNALLHSYDVYLNCFPIKTYLKRTFLRESFSPTNHLISFLPYLTNLFVARYNLLTRELEQNWF